MKTSTGGIAMEQKGFCRRSVPPQTEKPIGGIFLRTQIWKKAERFVPFTLWTDLGLPNNSFAKMYRKSSALEQVDFLFYSVFNINSP